MLLLTFISNLLCFFSYTSCLKSYLLWGYYQTQTEEYAFEWTIPQCVLTLRLIAVAFDVYDGRRIEFFRKRSEASAKEIVEKSAMERLPSLLELLADCYFPASFFVGPQFEIRRYIDFINRDESYFSYW